MRAKYSATMFELVQKTFKYLPLASVIEKSVFITHGGLFPFEDVTLEEIRALDRTALKKGRPATRTETLLQCIVWSDPQKEQGWAKSDRGAGILVRERIDVLP
jgi:diadenosine tetraphosphatase ApaH/serine/threonine PP2A family protein phosphatase